MKIIIDRNSLSERQSAVVTVDTKHCHYPYAIRESIELAMELDGYTKETIDEVCEIYYLIRRFHTTTSR